MKTLDINIIYIQLRFYGKISCVSKMFSCNVAKSLSGMLMQPLQSNLS